MKVFIFICTALITTSLYAETSKMSFDALNIILGQRHKLPENCVLIREEPVIKSRSPVVVEYTYILNKGSQSSKVVFEQSDRNLILETDNATYGSI